MFAPVPVTSGAIAKGDPEVDARVERDPVRAPTVFKINSVEASRERDGAQRIWNGWRDIVEVAEEPASLV